MATVKKAGEQVSELLDFGDVSKKGCEYLSLTC